MYLNRNMGRPRAAGFSLIEVLVALTVTGIGLLGLAKMESLAMSSTGVARSRGIAAIQAASLAASMHSTPGYWAAGFAPATTLISSAPANNFSVWIPCTTPGAASCSPQAVALEDLREWGIAVGNVLPGYLTTITCSTTGFPVTCTIQIQWTENVVAGNSAQTQINQLQGGVQTPTYTLFVQP
jgi:type IV pilus assembly protein PilV